MNQPPLIRPFVLIADIDNAVIVVTTVVVSINKNDSAGNMNNVGNACLK